MDHVCHGRIPVGAKPSTAVCNSSNVVSLLVNKFLVASSWSRNHMEAEPEETLTILSFTKSTKASVTRFGP